MLQFCCANGPEQYEISRIPLGLLGNARAWEKLPDAGLFYSQNLTPL